jgi:general secretion pathway protein D
LRRLTCGFVLAFAAILLGGCPKTNQDFDAGRKAEALDDYDTALVHYERALRAQPTNSEYKLRTLHMRMEDAQFHVEKGQKALIAGDLQTALTEFQRAQNVDASNEAAAQGLKKTLDAIGSKNAPSTAANTQAESETALLEGPPQLKPLDRTPINLKATEDSRMIYQTIAQLAGLTVEFDPTLTSRRIPVDLVNVTLEQALDAVDLETGDFWQPLTSTVIFVAPDNPQKRRDLEPEVVKVFYLANTETAQDMTEIVTGLRQLLDLRRVQPINAQNAIVIRDTPDKVALAEKIIADIDKPKPEVLIHVQVLTANRDHLRDLGILPGQSIVASFTPPCSLQANSSSGCTTGTGSSSTTTTSTGITLNNLKNLTGGAYSVLLPGATANAVLTDNQTHIIQEPEVRMTDGSKTTLKIGEQVPIASGSFQAGVGVSTTSVSPLVNTQFQYKDVGVTIDVTPRVHPNGDVSLKETITVTTLAGSENIGGINQPIISGPSIDNDVTLRDGEASVLGGMIQRTETKNVNGIPGAAQIPGVGYLFSDNSHDVQDDEVLIVLTPHVIRLPSIEAADLRTIASGTDTNARVYRSDKDAIAPAATSVASTDAAPGTPQPLGGPAVGSPQPASPAVVGLTAPAGASAQIRFDPANANMKVGDTSTVGLSVSGVNDLYSIPLMIKYDPAVIDIQEVRDGGFLSGGTQPVAIVQHIDKQSGQVIVSATRAKAPGVNGTGTLIGLVVHAIAPGSSQLQVLQVNARDSQQKPIPIAPFVATIQVQP